MAVKTITIDLEAYEILSRLKRPGLSFSEVIKANLGSTHRASDLLAALDRLALSEATAAAVTNQIRARSKQRARAPKV
jgi:predicted CopG family antitoxin